MSNLINGRVATQADVDANACTFFIPDNRSMPYSFGRSLPIAAKITKPEDESGFPPPGAIVRIVQAELVDGADVVLGIEYDGNEGICLLEDVEIIG